MFLILLALCVLAVSAAGLGLLAFARPTPATTRLADLFGLWGHRLRCALGMAGLFTDSWTGSLLWTQAWGLPVGSLSLGLDALSRVFLLPVFGLGLSVPVPGASRCAIPAPANITCRPLALLSAAGAGHGRGHDGP